MTNKEFRILALIENGDRRELSLNQHTAQREVLRQSTMMRAIPEKQPSNSCDNWNISHKEDLHTALEL